MNYKKELKEFQIFKANYRFKQANVTTKDDKLYCMDRLVKDELGYYG